LWSEKLFRTFNLGPKWEYKKGLSTFQTVPFY
jgi:hypothetical protein